MEYIALALLFMASICGAYFFADKVRAKKRAAVRTEGPYRVNKNTLMGVLLTIEPSTADLLVEMGMHCVGCPSHSHETLEQAAEVHNISVDELVNRINEYLEKK